ncbi:MAG: biopolymer transporter ExbD [Betaproteobacteria bacterium]|nr:biopolymer transporter ExbD [Betaproteobacteria bacterium]
MFWHDEPKRSARIELIPMIDVMMFLLVFFVLLSLNVIPAKGVRTELPAASQREDIRPARHLVIVIARSGELSMDGQSCSLGGLSARLTQATRAGGAVDVVVSGDKGVDMQALIDVMDVVKAAGIQSIAIASKPR